MLLQMALFPSFLWLSNIPPHIGTNLLYPLFCQWTFRCFHVLAILNSAAMKSFIPLYG